MSNPMTRRRLFLAAAALAVLPALGCAPNAALLRSPLAVHIAENPEGEGARRMVQWCDADGTCHVGPTAVLDERDVQSVGLNRGEGRITLQLRLNRRGLDRLAVLAQGSNAGGRLAVVVDDKALEANVVEEAARTGSVVLRGPVQPMQRLYDLLTSERPGREPPPPAP